MENSYTKTRDDGHSLEHDGQENFAFIDVKNIKTEPESDVYQTFAERDDSLCDIVKHEPLENEIVCESSFHGPCLCRNTHTAVNRIHYPIKTEEVDFTDFIKTEPIDGATSPENTSNEIQTSLEHSSSVDGKLLKDSEESFLKSKISLKGLSNEYYNPVEDTTENLLEEMKKVTNMKPQVKDLEDIRKAARTASSKLKSRRCYRCNKRFKVNIYNLHKCIVHPDERPCKCNFCDKGFINDRQLKRHVRIHTGEKPHSCNVCGKSFTRVDHLNIHIRTHTGEKPYKCDLCTKSYTQLNDLKIHLCLHRGEKSHKCELCDKKFIHPSYLKKHMRNHTGDKPHKCEVCEKSFAHQSSFRQHKLIHTGERPHICNICFKRFTRLNHLNTHMRTHTREKPYKCEICSKRFTQTSHLKIHVHKHSGEKPYTCEICHKKFTQTIHLKIHMIKHKKENHITVVNI